MKVSITVPSRVHMSLVELGSVGYRRNGGVGFALQSPVNKLEFQPSKLFDLAGLQYLGFTDAEIARLCCKLIEVKNRYRLAGAMRLSFASGAGRHVGTGSGTGVTLASLEALFALHSERIDAADLTRLSGRGGTSGVGIHTYFRGGFIVDVGRRFDSCTINSSDEVQKTKELPQLFVRHPMPAWRVGFLFPACEPLTLFQERAVFRSLEMTPMSPSDVHAIAYHCIFGAAAAVVASDLGGFCNAVNAVQTTAWKSREIRAHGQSVVTVMRRMRELGCDCVGMSSMGPGLYFLAIDFEAVIEKLKREFRDAIIVSTVSANQGREISYA